MNKYLYKLGITNDLEVYYRENNLSDLELARVIKEHKERYIISDGVHEMQAEILGNLRYSASGRESFPAVGDFVSYMSFDENNAIIHQVLPRNSVLKRQAVGKIGDVQIIASNVDYAFIVQSVGQDFNINRVERYLTQVYSGNLNPILVITKVDLVDDVAIEEVKEKLLDRKISIPVYFLSNETGVGVEELLAVIENQKTYCFVGSSGVGKSSLVNRLVGGSQLETKEISTSTGKGKHTTSHRELIVLSSGGILIDTPGMREFGTADTASGIEEAFDVISELAMECKFSDCTHNQEDGCAVLEAVEQGDLDKQTLSNYHKLEREREHYQSSLAEKRTKDKEFGKMVKSVMNMKKASKGK